jgi:ribosomal protein L37E
MTFTCPRCGAVSYNPNDIEAGYCGRCHWWTGDPVLGQVDPTEMERDNEPQD